MEENIVIDEVPLEVETTHICPFEYYGKIPRAHLIGEDGKIQFETYEMDNICPICKRYHDNIHKRSVVLRAIKVDEIPSNRKNVIKIIASLVSMLLIVCFVLIIRGHDSSCFLINF